MATPQELRSRTRLDMPCIQWPRHVQSEGFISRGWRPRTSRIGRELRPTSSSMVKIHLEGGCSMAFQPDSAAGAELGNAEECDEQWMRFSRRRGKLWQEQSTDEERMIRAL
jgi:hypothetical protein